MLRRILAALLLLALAAVGALLWAGHHLTRHAQTPTGALPALPGVRALAFPSDSGATLSAWFIPGVSGQGALLLLHPVRANKRAMLARARFLNRAGYGVLLIDLQAHGESSGERIAFGQREAADVQAAAAQLAALASGEKLGVLGISLGAAALLYAETGDGFGAAVLEAVYPTIEEAIANRLRIRFGTAGGWLAPLLSMQLEPRLGVPARALRPLERLPQLRSPVLIVHGAEDRHTTLAEAERMYAAARSPKDMYVVPGAAHVDLHAYAGEAYERRILAFFAQHLRSAARVP